MARRHYPQEQLDWLRAGYRHWRLPELTRRFNARFGLDLEARTLKATLKNHGIRSGRARGFRRGERVVIYTPEQIGWLRAHRASAPLAAVAERFRARFGVTCPDKSIAQLCKRQGIRAGSDGRFDGGVPPWNKGTHYTPGGRCVETQYQPGATPWQTQPVGSYRQSKDGYWLLKVGQSQQPGLSRHDWRLVHRLTWEAAHGPLPPRHAVVLLDGDKDHCMDIANLAAVHREELVILNKRGWHALRDPAQRAAMIEVVRLEVAARRAGRRLGLGRRAITRLMAGAGAPMG